MITPDVVCFTAVIGTLIHFVGSEPEIVDLAGKTHGLGNPGTKCELTWENMGKHGKTHRKERGLPCLIAVEELGATRILGLPCLWRHHTLHSTL